MRLLPARSLYHWARAVRRPWIVNACAFVVADVPIVSAVSSTTIDPVAAAGNAQEHPVIASDRLRSRVIPLLRKHSREHFERHFVGDDEVFTASGRRLSALHRWRKSAVCERASASAALNFSSGRLAEAIELAYASAMTVAFAHGFAASTAGLAPQWST